MDANTVFRICIVDDDPVTRQELAFFLDQPGYALNVFDSGTALLEALQDFDSVMPDLILLDVEMPGLDGISTCQRLRTELSVQSLVTFVSAHDDVETRLAAYDAGASDYLSKPYTEAELLHKVKVAEQWLQQRHGLASQARFAQQTAFSAMSSLGETGLVLDFLRNAFACKTPGDLASALTVTATEFGIHILSGLRYLGECCCFAGLTECSPLERSILDYAAAKGRLYQSRDRLIVNYPRVTLLISDLPVDDPDRVGRLRDHLASIAEGTDSRLAAMENETRCLLQNQTIVTAVRELAQTLAGIKQLQHGRSVQAIRSGEDYLEELENAFLHLGLSETQEIALIEMAQRAIGRTTRLLEADLALSERLSDLIGRLRAVADPTAPSAFG